MSGSPDLVLGIKWYLVFLFSTTFHEAAHAWMGLKLGDDTAHRGGQVTLDPTPHIKREPFGMVVVPIISYLLGGWMIGWASAPFDPEWARNNPQKKAWVSLAGPASNFILVLLASIGIRIGLAGHLFDVPETIGFSHVVDSHSEAGYVLGTFFSIVFSLNLLLCAFNLLPIPPLDGSGALMMFIHRDNSEGALSLLHNRQLQFFGLFIAWKVFDMIFSPIQTGVLNLLYLGLTHYQ